MFTRSCLLAFIIGMIISLTISPMLVTIFLNLNTDFRDQSLGIQIPSSNKISETSNGLHRSRRLANDVGSESNEKDEFSHFSELESLSLVEPRRVSPPEAIQQRAAKKPSKIQYRPRFLAHELSVLEHLLVIVHYNPTASSTLTLLRAYNRTIVEPLNRAFGSTGPHFALLPFDNDGNGNLPTRSPERSSYQFLEWFLREQYDRFARRYRYIFVHPLTTYVSIERLAELLRRAPLPNSEGDSSICETCAFGVPIADGATSARPASPEESNPKHRPNASTKSSAAAPASPPRASSDQQPKLFLDADSKQQMLQSSVNENAEESRAAAATTSDAAAEGLCDASLGVLFPLTSVERLHDRLRGCRAAGVTSAERICREQAMADVKCVGLREIYTLEFDELDVFAETSIARLLNLERPDEVPDEELNSEREAEAEAEALSGAANAAGAQLQESAPENAAVEEGEQHELLNRRAAASQEKENASALEEKLLAAFDAQAARNLATLCRERLRRFGAAREYVLVVRGLHDAFGFYYVHRLYVGIELALLEPTSMHYERADIGSNKKEEGSRSNGVHNHSSTANSTRVKDEKRRNGRESDSVRALEAELERRAELSPFPAESGVWSRGVHFGPSPRNRFEAIPWQKLNRTHILFRNEHSLFEPLSREDALDFEEVLEFTREEFNRLQNVRNNASTLWWEFDELLNGYRRLDPLTGVEYLLDIRFRQVDTLERVSHRFNVLKALSRIESAPMPYNAETAPVTVLLIAREPRVELQRRVRAAVSSRLQKGVGRRNATFSDAAASISADERLALLRSVLEEVEAEAVDDNEFGGLPQVLRLAAAAKEFCGGRLTADTLGECERLVSADPSRFRRQIDSTSISASTDAYAFRTSLESMLAFTRNLESSCITSGSGSSTSSKQDCFSDGRLRVIFVLLYSSAPESSSTNDTDSFDEPYDYFSPLKAELRHLQTRFVSSTRRPIRWFNAISHGDELSASKRHEFLDQQQEQPPTSSNSSQPLIVDGSLFDFKLSELLIQRELEDLRASNGSASVRNNKYTSALREQLDILRLLVETRQVDTRNLVFFVPPTATLSTDLLNRLRIHVIAERQAFFPIGFRLFHPLLSELESSTHTSPSQTPRVWDASRPPLERVQKGAGAFDELDFECTAAVAGDLLAADQRVLLQTRNESATASESADRIGLCYGTRQLDSLFSLLEQHAPHIHLLRPVEPSLVLECCAREAQNVASISDECEIDSHLREARAERRAAQLGTQQRLSAIAQLVRYLLEDLPPS